MATSLQTHTPQVSDAERLWLEFTYATFVHARLTLSGPASPSGQSQPFDLKERDDYAGYVDQQHQHLISEACRLHLFPQDVEAARQKVAQTPLVEVARAVQRLHPDLEVSPVLPEGKGRRVVVRLRGFLGRGLVAGRALGCAGEEPSPPRGDLPFRRLRVMLDDGRVITPMECHVTPIGSARVGATPA